MKHVLTGTLAATALAATLAAPVSAQEGMDLLTGPTTFEMDPSHSTILLSWDHQGFSTTYAVIREFETELTLDPENLENTELSATMHLDSLDSLWEARTADLESENFFNVEQFPAATFESTEVTRTGENTADVTGDFTLLGQTYPLTLAVTLNKVAEQDGRLRVGFDGEAAIQRADFGVTRFAPAVGGEVTIHISSELVEAE